MGIGDEVGKETASDVNQYVHSWLDDFDRRIRAILEDYEIKITFRKRECHEMPDIVDTTVRRSGGAG